MIKGNVQIDLTPLQGLKRSLVTKVLKKATAQAAKPVKRAVKDNATAVKLYGYLNKSIGVKVKVYQKAAVAIIGPRSKWKTERGVFTRGKKKGEPRTVRPSYYAHLLEGPAKRLKMKPFLKPALESTHETYFSILKTAIAGGISAQLAKMKK